MDNCSKYIFEAGMLKRVKRSGWWVAKINSPESVAEHSLRTAIIGLIIAKLEGKTDNEANRICTAAVFHDKHKTRLLDLNKITARYIDVDRTLERKVEREQVQTLPKEVRESVLSALELREDELKILKDADYLECAFSAKEYLEIGYTDAKEWMENNGKRLKTKAGNKLYQELVKTPSNSWWQGLKRKD
jgi:putative hydrolase of HD superfamily